MDSMGWLYFRKGNVGQSLYYLQRAYKLRPDAEIAAHLGEVLWSVGERDAARQVWDEALKMAPDSDVLQSTIKRLRQ